MKHSYAIIFMLAAIAIVLVVFLKIKVGSNNAIVPRTVTVTSSLR